MSSSELPSTQGAAATEHFTVTQRFDLKRMIESEATEVDLPVAIAELIDNSLDQTLTGKTCEVVITLDAKDSKLYFENRNTAGMDNTDFQSFMTWGLRHKEGRTYSEHGQGGKLAIVQLLDRDHGNLTIISQPANSISFKRMEIANWWQRLEQGLPFDVHSGISTEKGEKGFTRIELDGLRTDSVPANLTQLAESIGYIYAPLIKDSKLAITLRRISKGGGTVSQVNVLPIEIQFNKQQSFEQKGIPVKKGAIKFDIKWGLVDATLKESDKNARAAAYNTSALNMMEPETPYIYIRNRGRLHDKVPLSSLKLFRTGRYALASFAASVNIIEGVVERTMLKRGLSPTSPATALILNRIRDVIAPYIQEISKGSDMALSTKDKQKVKVASSKFGAVLLGLFNNQQSKIVEEFFSGPEFEFQGSSSEKPTAPTHQAPPSREGNISRNVTLPGIRGERVEGKSYKVRRIVDAIPELRIVDTFGKNVPVAELQRDTEAGRNKLVIGINFQNPEVRRLALQAKGDLGIIYLVKIGAQALYHQKWIEFAPKDSATYKEGVEEDVAKFLQKAEELKLI